MSASKIITLTTDFGIEDSYVSVLKGQIKRINSTAEIIDITHLIKQYSISSAAYIFKSILPYFPDKTAHIVVVDPGVGGARKPIIAELKAIDKQHCAYFIGPDNGILSLVSKNYRITIFEILPEKLNLFLRYKFKINYDFSNTFHGRDIFAPAAALLTAKKMHINNFTQKNNNFIALADCFAKKIEAKKYLVKVLHIDSFGNIITNLTITDLMPQKFRCLKIKNQVIDMLAHNYEQLPKQKKCGCIIGSMLHYEISANTASAAQLLKVKIGDDLIVFEK